MSSVGSLVSSILGTIQLTRFLPFFHTDVEALYSVGAVAVFIFVSTTLAFAPGTNPKLEQKRQEQRSLAADSAIHQGESLSLKEAALNLPKPIKHVYDLDEAGRIEKGMGDGQCSA